MAASVPADRDPAAAPGFTDGTSADLMARAMLQYEHGDDGGWVPVGVWLATPRRLQARMLPGSASRDAFMKYVLSDASRPHQSFSNTKGTWEDWIEWAVWSLTDGMIHFMTEVEPAVTLERLYARAVLGETVPGPLSDPKFTPTTEVPVLGGIKSTELRGGLGGKG